MIKTETAPSAVAFRPTEHVEFVLLVIPDVNGNSPTRIGTPVNTMICLLSLRSGNASPRPSPSMGTRSPMFVAASSAMILIRGFLDSRASCTRVSDNAP